MSQLALQQYKRSDIRAPYRGTIYSRNGREFAASVRLASVYMVPQETDHQRYHELARLLDFKDDRLEKKKKSSKRFVWVKRKLTPRLADKVRKMKLPGIHVTDEQSRVYIDKTLAGQLVGFVGIDNQGLEGIEYLFNSQLKAEGQGIRLTIDRKIQQITEAALYETCREHRPRSGMALVMEPFSGDVLALAVWPSYNPNRFGDYPAETWRNKIICDRFEPGSIMKVFTAAAALEERLYRPEDQIFCHNGAYRLHKGVIRDTKPLGWISFAQVIEKSSNIGTMQVAQDLGKKRLFHYLSRFGFGRKTGIRLPGESPGKLRPLKEWSPRSLASIAFGQELSVTALQFLTAFSCIVSDGVLVRPRIILSQASSRKGIRVISGRTSRLMKKILVGVVERGTGRKAGIAGYRVGGKTGTAQVFDSELGRYSPDKYVSSFVGFAPAEQPKITALVALNQPAQGGYYGGLVAAPAFKRLARETLAYLKVFPRKAAPIKMAAAGL